MTAGCNKETLINVKQVEWFINSNRASRLRIPATAVHAVFTLFVCHELNEMSGVYHIQSHENMPKFTLFLKATNSDPNDHFPTSLAYVVSMVYKPLSTTNWDVKGH